MHTSFYSCVQSCTRSCMVVCTNRTFETPRPRPETIDYMQQHIHMSPDSISTPRAGPTRNMHVSPAPPHRPPPTAVYPGHSAPSAFMHNDKSMERRRKKCAEERVNRANTEPSAMFVLHHPPFMLVFCEGFLAWETLTHRASPATPGSNSTRGLRYR